MYFYIYIGVINSHGNRKQSTFSLTILYIFTSFSRDISRVEQSWLNGPV